MIGPTHFRVAGTRVSRARGLSRPSGCFDAACLRCHRLIRSGEQSQQAAQMASDQAARTAVKASVMMIQKQAPLDSVPIPMPTP